MVFQPDRYLQGRVLPAVLVVTGGPRVERVNACDAFISLQLKHACLGFIPTGLGSVLRGALVTLLQGGEDRYCPFLLKRNVPVTL